MPHSLKTTIFNDHIRVEISGDILSTDEAIQLGHAVLARAAKENRLNCLFIQHDLTSHLDYHDMIVVADTLDSDNYHLQGYRTASVYRHKKNAPAEQYETVAATRGHSLRAFTDEKVALDWLLKR